MKQSAPSAIALALLLACSATSLIPPQATAQAPVHYQYSADDPPGVIGRQQVLRRGPWVGYLQPVLIRVPPGAHVMTTGDQVFAGESELAVKLMVGHVCRLKVTNIPRLEQAEVHPTIELINRLYPPPGQQQQFPIVIQLAQEDLELAVQGKMVVRVVYLENPDDALPVPDDPAQQPYFDVLPGEDPLQVADELGRPMAIVRMGSRVPDPLDPLVAADEVLHVTDN